ncbi:hypothetical protein BC829DRAFT_278799 [Chytridium lagenaria]|nr:hypothetical protein BC829DRAFT_278799 [Chytridium lagenaria]
MSLKPKGLLHITFLRGKHIKKGFLQTLADFGVIDPYIICSLNKRPEKPELIQPSDSDLADQNSIHNQDEEVQRTHAARGTEPIWNERLTFVIMQHMDTIFVDVFEKELGSADHMGKTTLDLSKDSLKDEWMKDIWIPLYNDKNEKLEAELQIVIHFVPTTTIAYLEREASVLYAKFKANIQARVQKAALDIIDQTGKSAADAKSRKLHCSVNKQTPFSFPSLFIKGSRIEKKRLVLDLSFFRFSHCFPQYFLFIMFLSLFACVCEADKTLRPFYVSAISIL